MNILNKKTILLAADHAGFELKEKLKIFLRAKGYEIEDLGAFALDKGDDYTDYMHMAGMRVGAEPETYVGIILGGSGQGEAMVANRYKNVRAAVYYGGKEETVKLAREHNNANILSLGARFVGEEEAERAVQLFLITPFSGEERHTRRIGEVDNPPSGNYTF